MESIGRAITLGGLLLLGIAAPAAFAAGAPLLELRAEIPLPNVKGRIDHLAADLEGQRIFIAALGNDTIEVVDTARNLRTRSLSGFGEPQGLSYLDGAKRLVAANGGSNRVDIIDGQSLASIRRVENLRDADNVRYDADSRVILVGHGSGALRTLDPDTGTSRGEIRLAGHPESFQLEQKGHRVFVNVPSAGHVAVADRSKREVIATWALSARGNFPMALDEAGRRLFVGARSPAVLLVHDLDSGKEVARLGIGGDVDDLFFDRERKRIYAICGEGTIDVVRQESPDRYVLERSVSTAPRARTGLFVPEASRIYVAAPAAGNSPARILVYAIR